MVAMAAISRKLQSRDVMYVKKELVLVLLYIALES